MSNSEKGTKSTKTERSAPKSERSSPKNECSGTILSTATPIIASRAYTAHEFAEYRKLRGALVRGMREKRRLTQSELGAPSQIRAFESGEATQIGTMEMLARLVPCPREMYKYASLSMRFFKVRCIGCRAKCTHKGDEAAFCRSVIAETTDEAEENAITAPDLLAGTKVDRRFIEYRRARGRLIRAMRKKRNWPQRFLGSQSQVRRYELGITSQIGTLEMLVKLQPCPREALKLWRAMWLYLPIACRNCRGVCDHKTTTADTLMRTVFREITMD